MRRYFICIILLCFPAIIFGQSSDFKTIPTTPLFTSPELISEVWTLPAETNYKSCSIVVQDSVEIVKSKADAKFITETINVEYNSSFPKKLSYSFKSKKSRVDDNVWYDISENSMYIVSSHKASLIRYSSDKRHIHKTEWENGDTSKKNRTTDQIIVANRIGIDSLTNETLADGSKSISTLGNTELINNRYRCVYLSNRGGTSTNDTTWVTLDSLGREIAIEVTILPDFAVTEEYTYDAKGNLIYCSQVLGSPTMGIIQSSKIYITRDQSGLPKRLVHRTSNNTFTLDITWNK